MQPAAMSAEKVWSNAPSALLRGLQVGWIAKEVLQDVPQVMEASQLCGFAAAAAAGQRDAALQQQQLPRPPRRTPPPSEGFVATSTCVPAALGARGGTPAGNNNNFCAAWPRLDAFCDDFEDLELREQVGRWERVWCASQPAVCASLFRSMRRAACRDFVVKEAAAPPCAGPARGRQLPRRCANHPPSPPACRPPPAAGQGQAPSGRRGGRGG